MPQRLDQHLIALGLVPDLFTARGLIMAGKVLVNDRPSVKPGVTIPANAKIRLKDPPWPWVSRGGVKLAAAMEACAIDLTGCCCLDIGASTGGFTDVMLTHGASRVYAMDVGYGQLAWKLVQDPRVVVMDRCNIRHLQPKDLQTPVDFLTADLSFISLSQALPFAIPCLRPGGSGVVLIKPQFELAQDQVEKGGVITNPVAHQAAIQQVQNMAEGLGLQSMRILPSPIPGPAGNKEFLYYFRLNQGHYPA
ncbi:MAG: TlyA family RNA methyltransferase [Magnetococcus sp. YQC-5]